ncbi:MAG: hypothetical protein QNJ70_08380 [Xenococcaceae cyanobacterium MO_207.B15]|nr:hypothetical protein [Xenococcaceae cyanobacterium MO_207.B15]MDJ0745187.1 hypothetical protein [Xenococcaceae cyanobacterium MO_167.B27]
MLNFVAEFPIVKELNSFFVLVIASGRRKDGQNRPHPSIFMPHPLFFVSHPLSF